jgi:magnesium chelatase subunit D
MADDLKSLETWNDAMTSLQLLQIDPHGLGGSLGALRPLGPSANVGCSICRKRVSTPSSCLGISMSERLLGALICRAPCNQASLHMQSGLLATSGPRCGLHQHG